MEFNFLPKETVKKKIAAISRKEIELAVGKLRCSIFHSMNNPTGLKYEIDYLPILYETPEMESICRELHSLGWVTKVEYEMIRSINAVPTCKLHIS